MSTNPLLDDIENTDVITVPITLPTGGVFYDENVVDKTIDFADAPVSAYSVWEESLFSDPYQIMSGKSTKSMIRKVASWVRNPMELARLDVEMIFIAAKIASYGEKIDITVECSNPATKEVSKAGSTTETETVPVCGAATNVSVDLREVMIQYPTGMNPKDWVLKLASGQVVNLRPPRISDELYVSKEAMTAQQRLQHQFGQQKDMDFDAANAMVEKTQSELLDMQISTMLRLIRSSIVSVKTAKGVVVKDINQIDEWLAKLGTPTLMTIRDFLKEKADDYRKIGTFDFRCPLCNHVTPNVPTITDQAAFFGEGFLARRTRKPSSK